MIKINKSKLAKIILFSLIIITIFSFLFYRYDYSHFNGLNENNDKEKLFNRIYFTVTTLSSAGYGDITPKSKEVKLLSIILQFILITGLMGGVVTIFG